MNVEAPRSSDLFPLIVEGSPHAMIVADERGLIALVNAPAEALFGYGRAELLGRPLEILIPERSRTRHAGLAAAFFASPQNRVMGAGLELHGLRKDGTLVALEIGLNPLHTPGGLLTLASITDITERTRAQAMQQRMTALIESAEDAILTKSLDGTIRSWNPGAQTLLGYTAEEIVGESITRLIPADRRAEEDLIIAQLREGRRVAHFETVRRRKDGSLVDVSLTISPLRDVSGAVVGASKIMRDISERKRAEQALRRSNIELEQINKELDDFVYTASHDLRAPLTGVSTLAQWILEDDRSLTATSRERLILIQGRIERMKRLLEDIRDYARAGQFTDPGPTVTAASLVQEVVATSFLREGFVVECAPSLQAVQVSRVPLEQVFHNLIGNAIKHHDRKTGNVWVSMRENGAKLRFEVRDDGPGVPPEYRESIFEMFETLKPRDSVEGSGMGLALVRKIVGKMGGNCGVQASDGRGATFWFDWPAQDRGPR